MASNLAWNGVRSFLCSRQRPILTKLSRPNVLALNLSALTQSVVFFLIFQLIALAVVAYFHRATSRFVQSQPMHEGLLEHPEGARGGGWGVLWASFLLIILYLPVSTIAVHALVSD